MGYSVTAAADNTFRSIMNNSNGRTANSWEYKGKRYFAEIGRENLDGAMTGSVYRFVGENRARRVGSFRINPDGTVARFPHLNPRMRAIARSAR